MQYIIGEDNRTVVAVMKGTENDVLDYIASKDKGLAALAGRRIVDGVSVYDTPENVPVDLKIRNTYVGVARCSEKDVFDPEKGKDIAKNKALIKHHKAMQKKLCIWSDHVYDQTEKLLKKNLYRVLRAARTIESEAK